MPFEMMDILEFPAMPSPWSSLDVGETWVIGNFFVTFPKSPVPVFEMLAKLNKREFKKLSVSHHWAMFLFYQLDRNPVRKSHCPILCISLEQADSSQASFFLKSLENQKGPMPVFVRLFKKGIRLNCGEYHGPLDKDSVRSFFFTEVANHGIIGDPIKIGDLASAHGHPNTGLPPEKNSTGCGVVSFYYLAILLEATRLLC